MFALLDEGDDQAVLDDRRVVVGLVQEVAQAEEAVLVRGYVGGVAQEVGNSGHAALLDGAHARGGVFVGRQ